MRDLPEVYTQAVDALSRALKFGINPSLEGIRRLTEELGRPQDALRVVQVTGTNGKSSVTRLTAAILQAHGERAAAYTSPHLVDYNERIELDGAPAPMEAFGEAVLASARAAERVGGDFTEFEILTGAALWLMREQGVRWACLEVGLGGRWDATSVTSPAVAVVTGVGLDHTDRLGETVESIAADKAQIVKPGAAAVLGPGTVAVRGILTARAQEVGAPVLTVGEADDVTFDVLVAPRGPGGELHLTVRTPLAIYADLSVVAPSYQAANVATAVAAAEAALGLPLDDAALSSALAGMCFPGRFELLATDPPLVIDGAHNPQAAATLATAIAEAYPADKPALVLGILADKDAEGIVSALVPVAGPLFATAPPSPRARSARELAALVERMAGRACTPIEGVGNAAEAARATSPSGAVVTGSLYTAGEARAFYVGQR